MDARSYHEPRENTLRGSFKRNESALLVCVSLLASVAASAQEPWSIAEPVPREGNQAPHILLIYDMEGIAGQDDISTADSSQPAAYAKGRRLLTDDVNAVINGLFAGGAREVSIADGHGGGNRQDDILRDEVDSRAQLILKTPLDAYRDLGESGIYDGVAAVAMHAKTGSGGFYAHTWTLGIDFIINGESMNETELLGMGFGEAGVPVIFASGDDRLGEELKSMPWLTYVTVKQATGTSSARLFPLQESRAQLFDGARRAVKRLEDAKIIRVSTPVQVTVRAFPPADLSWLEEMPGIDYRQDAVHFTAPNFRSAYRGMTRIGVAAYQRYFNTALPAALRAHKDATEIEMRAGQAQRKEWLESEAKRAQQVP